VKPQIAKPTAAASECLGFGSCSSPIPLSGNSKFALVLRQTQPSWDQSKTTKIELLKIGSTPD